MTTQLLPALKPAEFEALRDSIARDGVIVPVLVRPGGEIIDGHHRRRVTAELGVPCPEHVVDVDDETADRWRLITNLARRHLTEWERLEMLAQLAAPLLEQAQTEAKERQGTRTDLVASPSTKSAKSRDVAAAKLAEEIERIGAPVAPVSGKTLEKAVAFAALPETRKAAVAAGVESPAQAIKSHKRDQSRADAQERETARRAEAAAQTELRFDLRTGDFRETLADVADDSVDLILTDPPYGDDAVALYADLAKFAARVLKPGGSLVAYCGQATLPDVLAVTGVHLRYWWTLALTHSSGPQQLPGKWVMVRWKPLVWFVKDRRKDDRRYVDDVIKGTPPRKELHEWAQGLDEIKPLIDALTDPGGLVVDPFAGSGTTGHAANQLGRHFIGSDIPRPKEQG